MIKRGRHRHSYVSKKYFEDLRTRIFLLHFPVISAASVIFMRHDRRTKKLNSHVFMKNV
jgi:cell division protein FtsL